MCVWGGGGGGPLPTPMDKVYTDKGGIKHKTVIP